MDRPRLFRGLRIALSAVFGILCVLLIALWVRSYWRADRLESVSSGPDYFVLGSGRGLIILGGGPNSRVPPISALKYSSFPAAKVPTPTTFGFGYSEISAVGLRALYIPYWFGVLVAAASVAVPWIPWRFSLRTLLIAMTLVAVGLGLIVALSRKPPGTPPFDHGGWPADVDVVR